MSAQVREKTMRKLVTLTLGGVVAGALAGCVPDVQSIDRTQPNALSKDMFSGIWYHRSTVVEADPDAPSYRGFWGRSLAYEGVASGLEKIRWEITEDLLIAYRSYEFIPYAEGLTDEGRDFFGAPVAAFPIESHFDIQREYNATTGVETTVISENTMDRPWNERQYMRVDWSENMVRQPTNFQIGFNNYPSGTLSGQAAVAYYVQAQEETSPFRPVITQDYFDITNIYSLEPSSYFCLMLQLFQGAGRCGAANAKVRLSFRRVDPQDDYESLYYPDNLELQDDAGNAIFLNFGGRPCDSVRDPSECTKQTWSYDGAYGNFRILRVAFDRERFLTRTGRIYLAGRFDLWEDSFADDGSLIQYEARTPQPVVYYGNATLPDRMLEPTRQIAESWSEPFDETVALLKYHNNDLNNGVGVRAEQLQASIQRIREEAGGPMFQFRQNACNVDNVIQYAQDNGLTDVITRTVGPVSNLAIGNVENVCAAIQFAELQQGKTLDPKVAESQGVPLAFSWQRLGDLRFNFMNYIDEAVPGPLGIAQFAQDPETGEYVGNIANYFAAGGDSIAQEEVDVLQWLNGTLSEEELLRGDITRNEIVSRRTVSNNKINKSVKQFLMDHEEKLLAENGGVLFNETTPGSEAERFKRMWGGTDIERELLVDEELLRGFAGPSLYQPFGGNVTPTDLDVSEGLVPLTPGQVSGSAVGAASLVNFGTTPETNEFMRAALELGQNGVCMADFFDPNSSGLAEFVKDWDRERIFRFIQEEMYKAVQGHEVGHTVGLRHNFRGSMDPVNYKPEFWFEECPAEATAEQCDPQVGIQRWASPPNQNNRTQRNEYMYASIMDYGFDVPLWGFHGIGTYDKAAIRFMYGQIQEVWDNQKVQMPDARKYRGYARRCGHESDSFGYPNLSFWMSPEYLPVLLSQTAIDQSACENDYDNNEDCDSDIDALLRDFVNRSEAFAADNNWRTECAAFAFDVLPDLNNLMNEIKNLPPDARNIYDARKFVSTNFLIQQQKEVLANTPEYDLAETANVDESNDNVDSDNDGVIDDKGFNYAQYQFPIRHGYCSDRYASFENPFCQRWDAGWDFEESTQNHIMRFDRDYVFNHFRRDRFATWGNPRTYMARVTARRLFHMTNVFRYYLFTRRSAFDADIFDDYAEAAYRGVNFLERIIQAPEPGRYCLDEVENIYRPYSGAGDCNQAFDVPLGFGGGYQLQSSWSDDYFYEPNVIGYFYDKLAAIQQMTTSSGRFATSFDDLFDRRAFSLGYLRVYLDPMLQRFASLIQGDHTGYRSRVVTDAETQERFVRYMPLFDEERETDQSSVRNWLVQYPEIEPAWSWTLQYTALSYSLANWSSVADFAPEMYRFTKISIRGTPEDVEYPADIEIIEFTDPETRITYRAPVIEPFLERGRLQEFPAYYGDRWHQNQNPPMFRNWGVGANILQEANDYVQQTYEPARAGCEDGVDVGPDPTDRWPTSDAACDDFDLARSGLNERTGYIDLVRKFNRRAEVPVPQ